MNTFKTEKEATATCPATHHVVELYTGVWIHEETNPAPQPAMTRAAAMLRARY